VRVGDTVRRTMPANADWVHALLAHLHAHGFDAAPEFLGVDERGREILSYVDGGTRRGAEPSDDVLAEVMRLVRRLHDLTSGSELAGDAECVVHRDLSPRNTVYRDGRVVALIDWDGAGPGRRIEDVSRACWQFVEHGPGCDPARVGRRWRLMADAYGLSAAERRPLVAEVIARLTENAAGIEREAAAGSEGHIRLLEMGAPGVIRTVGDWVAEHAEGIEREVAN
jgi:aminoglycoside phosphotransferase (APT) family kinase protein